MVAVGIGVAMSGEMLGHSHHTFILHSHSIESTQPSYFFPIATKGTCTDNRIEWIRIDVHHRSEVDMYPHSTALLSNLRPQLIDKAVGTGWQLAKAGVAGKRILVFKPHAKPPLGVHTD